MAKVAMIVTNACNPDPRVERSANWLADIGHEVVIHAYDRQHVSESVVGQQTVKIYRHKLIKSPYGGFFRTAFGLIQFSRKLKKILSGSKPDVLICHDADTLSVGTFMKKKFQIPVIFDMHDLHHTWVRMKKPNSFFRKVIASMMLHSSIRKMKNMDLIITSSGSISAGTTPGFKEWLEERGFESKVVENRPLIFKNVPVPPSLKWRVSYIGRLRDIESIKFLLDAIEQIPTENRPELHLGGEGVSQEKIFSEIESFCKRVSINCSFSGAFNQNSISDLLKETNVMYAMYNPLRGNISEGALPVKMFDAAAHAIPSVVNSGCLMGELCEAENLGLSVKWGDVQGLSKALLSLRLERVELKVTGEKSRIDYLGAVSSIIDVD